MLRAVIFVCALVPFCVQADIYRCKQPGGHVAFSEAPCENGKAEKIELKTPAVITSSNNTVAVEENLVLNGSFEEGAEYWSLANEANWEPQRGKASSAAVSIQVDKKDNDRFGQQTEISQCVRLDDSASFILSADVYLQGIPEKNLANRVHLIWYSAEDCSSGGQWAHYLEPRPVSSWQHLRSKPLAPSMGARAAKIRLVQVGKYANGAKTVWDNIAFVASGKPARMNDNIEFVDAPIGTNLIKNGEFAQGLEHWRRSAMIWNGKTGRQSKGSARTELQSKRAGFGTGVGSQCVQLALGRRYQLSGWVMKDFKSTQTGGGRLRITWYSDTACRQGGKTSGNHADFEDRNGWQALRIDGLEAPEMAASARIELIQSIKGIGVFAVFWDDLALSLVAN